MCASCALQPFLSGEEKAWGELHHGIAIAKGLLERGWRLHLHKDPQRQEGNRHKFHCGRFHLGVKFLESSSLEDFTM